MSADKRREHGPREAISPSRAVATNVLARVAEDGAWAMQALDAELAASKLDPRDAALATEIVYGSLRVLPAIDRRIDAALDRGGASLEPYTRAALRAMTYQLVHLGRVPAHAAVSETVTLVAVKRGKGLGRLVNAVGRKLARERPEHPEPPVALELPEWVSRELVSSLGPERAQAFATSRVVPPPLTLRVTDPARRGVLLAAIREALPNVEAHESLVSPHALLLRHAGDPRALPGFADGAIAVQDEGSQIIAALVAAAAGERVLDACAGRGGKTAVLASQVGEAGEVVAVDRHEGKLSRISAELVRLGIRTTLRTACVDLSVGAGGLAEKSFDRVLVDAPCTGLGTIHRRPEILLRLRPEDPARLATLQRAIVARAASLVREGGMLVYSVCSFALAEATPWADDDALLRAFKPMNPGIYGLAADADGALRLGPWNVPDSDAYQVRAFQRMSA